MDTTAWVALAGILGTLAGSIGAPIVAERMRRRGAREERLLTERLAAYTDLIGELARLEEFIRGEPGGRILSAHDSDRDEHLRRVLNRAEIVAGAQVIAAVERFFDAVDAISPNSDSSRRAAQLDALRAAEAKVRDAIRAELGSR